MCESEPAVQSCLICGEPYGTQDQWSEKCSMHTLPAKCDPLTCTHNCPVQHYCLPQKCKNA